jgi:hypothetical protein
MAAARPDRICWSGNPAPSGPSPVSPGPGTNGEVVLVPAGDVVLDVDPLELDAGVVVFAVVEPEGGGVDVEWVGGALEGGVDGVVGVVGVVGGVGGVDGGVEVDGGGLVGGVVGPHGPWLRLNCPDQLS